MNFKTLKSKNEGYIALVTILIISAVVLVIAVNAGLLGISESDMGLIKNQASEAYYLASACAEYAVAKLKDKLNYPGNETLNIGDGSCYIYQPEGSGNQDRVVKTTGTIYNLTRKIKININRVRPETEIASWQEVSNLE